MVPIVSLHSLHLIDSKTEPHQDKVRCERPLSWFLCGTRIHWRVDWSGLTMTQGDFPACLPLAQAMTQARVVRGSGHGSSYFSPGAVYTVPGISGLSFWLSPQGMGRRGAVVWASKGLCVKVQWSLRAWVKAHRAGLWVRDRAPVCPLDIHIEVLWCARAGDTPLDNSDPTPAFLGPLFQKRNSDHQQNKLDG